jgi:uncharacterized protein
MGENTITHIEIPAPDLTKAIDFYSTVFDWEIQIIKPGSYAYFIVGKTNSGGGLDASLKPAGERCGPQITIDVDDIGEALQKIKEKGGVITLPKTGIEGGHGFYACFQDTNKNHLQIHSTS